MKNLIKIHTSNFKIYLYCIEQYGAITKCIHKTLYYIACFVASKKTRNMESLMAANSVLECFTILLDENLFSKADVSFIQFLCKETNCEELHNKCADYPREKEIHFFKEGINVLIF